MIWQDGLALLIVLAAVVMLVRIYAPRLYGSVRGQEPGAANDGCGHCAAKSSCNMVRSKENSSDPR